MRSPEKGAETALYAAMAPEMEGVTDIVVQESWTYSFAGSHYCTRFTAIAYPMR